MRSRQRLEITKFATGVAALLAMLVAPYFSFAKAKDEPKWIEVHTAHFSVITDAGDKRGREVALRMEQMRAIFGQLLLKDKLKTPVPITSSRLRVTSGTARLLQRNRAWRAGFMSRDRIAFISF